MSGADREHRTPGEVFVGREQEIGKLHECADLVRSGDSWLAVVEGEAGIGKSALLRRLTASLTDFTVLSALGDSSEADLPGGVIGQLTHRIDRARLADFPLLTGPSVAGPAHAIGGQLLLLLGALQESGKGIAVVVDDLQWADRLSVQSLGFVLRRLWADRVLTVLLTRPDPDGFAEPVDRLLRSLDRSVRIDLGGLGGPDVARLADELVEGTVAPPLADRLYEYTHGHPLHVRTVLAEVPAEALRDGVLEQWPVPHSLRLGIRAQLNRLPVESRDLLEALAVLDARVPLATAGGLAGLADPARALGPALAAGLAQWWPADHQSPVSLVHALQRDAVYAGLSPEHRRALHAGAAEVVSTAAGWAHRVAAAAGPDPGLADELEQSGWQEAANGRSALAANRLLWASSLSERREDRERRLLTACAQSLLTQQPGWSLRVRPQVEDCSQGPLRSCVLGAQDMMTGRLATAQSRLAQAWHDALAGSGADWVTVLAGTFLANFHLWNGQGAEAVEVAARTLALGGMDPGTTDFIRALVATGRLWDQGPRAAVADLAHLPAEALAVPDEHLDSLATRGAIRLFLGELAAARADLRTVALRDQQGAASKFGPLTLAFAAIVDYLAGDWDTSRSVADRALAVAAAHDQQMGDSSARFAAVCVLAGRGEWDSALQQIDSLQQMAEEVGGSSEIVFAALASATVAQAVADFPAMLRSLRPLLDGAPETGEVVGLRYKPFRMWQQTLLVEALTGTGRLDAAEAVLSALREEFAGRAYPDIVLARLAGRCAEARNRPQDALAIYERALAAPADGDHAGDAAPLERAMLEHAYGKLLLATGTGSRRDAATWLGAAHRRFGALGAAPFLTRCDADLAAGGLTAPDDAPGGRLGLTQRELSVAYVIASGRTNQEAAAELYVSQKTVEYHLSHVYAKLGISSRRQLADALQARESRI